jgi:protein-disulfide isomerase
MRKVMGTLVTGVLTLCAVIVTGLLIRQEFLEPSVPASPPPPVHVPDWRTYASGGHRSGPDDAPVTMVVFSDFQCPACRILVTHLKALRTEFPDDFAVIHRHSLLSIHPFAVDAARASECAAEQNRFTAFHDVLFIDQASIGLAPWNRFAVNAGVPDVSAFDKCMDSRKPSDVLHADTLAANRLNVAGTPTLLVNGLRFVGTPPLDTLRSIVQRARARSAH